MSLGALQVARAVSVDVVVVVVVDVVVIVVVIVDGAAVRMVVTIKVGVMVL